MSNSNNLPTTSETVSVSPNDPGFTKSSFENLGAVPDSHPAVQELGRSGLKKTAAEGAAEFISEAIYGENKEWAREWLQNHESADLRRAKFLIRESDKFPDGWLKLSMWVDIETGDTTINWDEDQAVLSEFDDIEAKNLRKIEVPRPIGQVLEAARTLGYDPTIQIDVYHDERKIVTQDNGDGMTPTEYDEYFNTPFEGLSKEDSESGGKFGVGSESAAIVHGKEGKMLVETRSTKPKNGNIRRGFVATSSLGGGNIVPGEVEGGFIGTRFKIPVKEDFDLTKLQDWVEQFTEKLRVPVLYREHTAGNTPVEEEYTATSFVDDYPEAPVVVERPGEFSLVAGPDVCPSTSYSEPDTPNTYLVSMKIDRNSRYRISTLWDVVVQIHDEQQRIVHGPNRGKFAGDVDSLHEDDVVLPKPSGDRGRLKRSSESKDFWRYIESVVKEEELKQVAEIADRMKSADHPADAIRENMDDWKMFKKMVSYHSSRRTMDSRSRFKSFLDDTEAFPDFDDDVKTKIYKLFNEVSYCHRGSGRSSKKKSRKEVYLGKILAKHDDATVYMAASTGGKFSDKFKVARHNDSEAEVIVIGSASKYETWKRHFGFKKLKNLPVTKSDDHRFDVPDGVHSRNKKTKSSKKSRGKADDIDKRNLKIRTDGDNSSVDWRPTIERVKTYLEKGKSFKGHQKLVLFPTTGDENISDNYGLADYAAIASVSKTEYDELSHYDDVMTVSEFKQWSRTALIATEDGAMHPDELADDDRMVVLTFRPKGNTEIPKLLADDHEDLRRLYVEDVRDKFRWAKILDGYDGSYRSDDLNNVDDSDKRDTLFAVVDRIVLKRAEWAFEQVNTDEPNMTGLRLSHADYGHKNPVPWHKLDGSATTYRLMVDTPNWDNDSAIYDKMPSNHDSQRAQILLGFHDRGVDPTNHSPKELRKMI